MKCPKCGYERQPNDNKFAPATECPACGVVYAKTATPLAVPGMTPSPTVRKPSPVDETSLKRARDRVEKKLRQRMKNAEKEARKEKTLQHARRLAAEGVRQRQAAWKRRQMDRNSGPDDRTMAEAAIRVKDPAADLNAFKNGALTMFGVIRPGKEVNLEEGRAKKAGHIPRKTETTVSLTDSLSKMAPGDSLPSNSPPKAVERSHRAGPCPENGGPIAENTRRPPVAAPEAIEAPTLTIALPAAQKRSARFGKQRPAAPTPPTQRLSDGVFMRLLPGAAWLILVIGLTGAVLSWTTLGDVHADMQGVVTTDIGAVPVALLLGFAYLATGVLGFAFFWACTRIGGQLKEIQEKLPNKNP